MSPWITTSRTPSAERIAARWRTQTALGWAEVLPTEADALVAIVLDEQTPSDAVSSSETSPSETPRRVIRAVAAFARACGGMGVGLEETAAWVRALRDELPRGRRDAFDGFDTGIALAEGWAAGSGLRVDTVGRSMAILTERLAHEHRAAVAAGVDPSLAWALAVVEAAPRPPVDIATADAMLARVVDDVLGLGVTAAWTGRRLIALVWRDDDLPAGLTALSGAVGTALTSLLRPGIGQPAEPSDPGRRAVAIRTWIEPVPADPTWLGAIIDDLAR